MVKYYDADWYCEVNCINVMTQLVALCSAGKEILSKNDIGNLLIKTLVAGKILLNPATRLDKSQSKARRDRQTDN